MQSINALAEDLTRYLEVDEIQQVKRAFYYAEQAHSGQSRRSGEAYISHPLAVARILSGMNMDHQSLMAAMLHDVIEDTGISKEALGRQFGEPVAELVDGVSKLTQIEFASRAEAQAENFQKMALAMAKDIRVILVKLADRLHNMRTLDVLSSDKRRRIAKETLEMYAPIANRLGMNNIRVEFEELGFLALHPMRSERIRVAVRNIRGNRKELVENVRQIIENHLHAEKIDAEVFGREKHLYSIYQKMRIKKKSFSEIMDVYAFRIIVDKVDTCYRVLGAIHSLYKPVPGHFKDYIAIPKANGYQSLHTVLFGMHGVPIEIQIRTREMDEMANNGIAAHWLYKTDEGQPKVLSGSHARARQWVQGLLEMQQHAGNSLEFIENVKIDLFPDEVYVFTPKGNILELPHGATAVDFAYAVHTDVGNRCVACKINRRLAPLSEHLQSGQTVEVITSPGAHPNPAWLNFVVSGKARSNIRHYLKTQRHNEAMELGERLLNKALASFNTSIENISQAQIDRLLESTGHNVFDYVLEDIGLGNRVAYVTASQLVSAQIVEPAGEHDDKAVHSGTAAAGSSFVVSGNEGMMMSYARCCHPIPGDPIVGYISAGRGVIVHTETCNNIAEYRNDVRKCINLTWADDIEGEFAVDLRVDVEQQKGIVAELATKINSLDASIEKIGVEDKDARFSVVRLEIAVHNRVHLARIMRHLRNIKPVSKVSRIKNSASWRRKS